MNIFFKKTLRGIIKCRNLNKWDKKHFKDSIKEKIGNIENYKNPTILSPNITASLTRQPLTPNTHTHAHILTSKVIGERVGWGWGVLLRVHSIVLFFTNSRRVNIIQKGLPCNVKEF